MEKRSILDNDIIERFELNTTSKNNLIQAAKWAKFLAIMLYLGSFWMVGQFIQMTIDSQNSYSKNSLDSGELFAGLISIAMIIFTFFAAYNLLSFANRAVLGLRKNNNKIFAISIESLKSYFKFYGLFTVVISIFTAFFFYLIYLQLYYSGVGLGG